MDAYPYKPKTQIRAYEKSYPTQIDSEPTPMRIAISCPNLDEQTNVSGIVSVVRNIMQNTTNEYYHYLLGKPDKALPLLLRIKTLFKQFNGIKRFLKENQIEIYHQNYPFDRNGVLREAIISLLVSQTGTPIILHIHGGAFYRNPNTFLNKIAQYSMNRANRIIVISDYEKQIIDSTFGVNTLVLPNAINCKLYQPQEHSIEKKETINLLYLGRIEVNKGINELIEAVKLCNLNIRLTVCGEGPMKDTIINECSSILGDRFTYAGVVKGEEKINIIQQHDIFVLPSYFEGMPIALLETMACGVIPIASHVGSIPKVIKDQSNGFILKQINGEAICRLIENYNRLSAESKKNLRANAVNTIQKYHNQNNYFTQLNSIYQHITPNE